MGANRRQQRAFTVLADLYEPADPSVDPDTQAIRDTPRWNPEPVATLVRCMHQNSQEDNVPGTIGRGTGSFMENIDRFKFPLGVDVRDGFLIHVRSEWDVSDGSWYVTQGGTADRTRYFRRTANQKRISAIKVGRPEGVVVPIVNDEGLV